MSDLTRCNFCTLQDMRSRAKREHKRVVTLACWPQGGVDVFIYPWGMSRSQLVEEIKTKEGRDRYFAAWFWDLGCVC